MTEDGVIVQTEETIEKEILGFYKQLLGSAKNQLPCIDPTEMQEGQTLNGEQQLQLIAHVTKEEISIAI